MEWGINWNDIGDGERAQVRLIRQEHGVKARPERVRVYEMGGGVERGVHVGERGGREQECEGEYGGTGWVTIGGGLVRGSGGEHSCWGEWAWGPWGKPRG